VAINLKDIYTNFVAATSSYPGGSFKNRASTGATDGTPLEKQWANDWLGFFQAILAAGAITPSGAPDTALASDYLNALKVIFAAHAHRHDGTLAPLMGAVDTGSANAYAVALTPALTAHVAYMPISFKAAHTNTGASTLAINGLSAVALKRPDGSALLAGDIVTGQLIIAMYDGTNYQVVSSGMNYDARRVLVVDGVSTASGNRSIALLAGGSHHFYDISVYSPGVDIDQGWISVGPAYCYIERSASGDSLVIHTSTSQSVYYKVYAHS
jgi:hypothetical protein